MLAAFVTAPGAVQLREVPVPVPRPGELLVRVEAALTCGTDLKTIQRGHPLIPVPCPLGHEFAGVVAACGDGVDAFRAGDSIACVPTAPCRVCRECVRDRESLCEVAVAEMTFGAFAEYIRLPPRLTATNVFPRPAGMTAASAALLEPLSCVVHGLARLDLSDVNDAVIIGDGPIALMFARLLVLAGLASVRVEGRHELRLEAARAFGASAVRLDGDTEPRRADLVVECVGTPATWERAVHRVSPGGTALLYGGCAGGTTVTLDTFPIHYREVDVRGAFHYDRAAVRTALGLLESGVVDETMFVTHRCSLEDLHEALDLARARKAIKVAVIPE